ncbi:hypothetical protein DIPPA_11807 [Diplonema papillatum]|nr:hypothetical protein DIPPA_11807 [Diplonema papillatum]
MRKEPPPLPTGEGYVDPEEALRERLRSDAPLHMAGSPYAVIDLPEAPREDELGSVCDAAAKAACLLLDVYTSLRKGTDPPSLGVGKTPWCADTLRRLFAACRAPGGAAGGDELHFYGEARHVAVLCLDSLFEVAVLDGAASRALSAGALATVFRAVAARAEQNRADNTGGGAALAYQTTLPRSTSRAVHAETCLDARNAAAEHAAQSALFVLSLSVPGSPHPDDEPSDPAAPAEKQAPPGAPASGGGEAAEETSGESCDRKAAESRAAAANGGAPKSDEPDVQKGDDPCGLKGAEESGVQKSGGASETPKSGEEPGVRKSSESGAPTSTAEEEPGVQKGDEPSGVQKSDETPAGVQNNGGSGAQKSGGKSGGVLPNGAAAVLEAPAAVLGGACDRWWGHALNVGVLGGGQQLVLAGDAAVGADSLAVSWLAGELASRWPGFTAGDDTKSDDLEQPADSPRADALAPEPETPLNASASAAQLRKAAAADRAGSASKRRLTQKKVSVTHAPPTPTANQQQASTPTAQEQLQLQQQQDQQQQQQQQQHSALSRPLPELGRFVDKPTGLRPLRHHPGAATRPLFAAEFAGSRQRWRTAAADAGACTTTLRCPTAGLRRCGVTVDAFVQVVGVLAYWALAARLPHATHFVSLHHFREGRDDGGCVPAMQAAARAFVRGFDGNRLEACALQDLLVAACDEAAALRHHAAEGRVVPAAALEGHRPQYTAGAAHVPPPRLGAAAAAAAAGQPAAAALPYRVYANPGGGAPLHFSYQARDGVPGVTVSFSWLRKDCAAFPACFEASYSSCVDLIEFTSNKRVKVASR